MKEPATSAQADTYLDTLEERLERISRAAPAPQAATATAHIATLARLRPRLVLLRSNANAMSFVELHEVLRIVRFAEELS